MLEAGTVLTAWLKPVIRNPGHRKPRQMCPIYVSCLIGPGECRSAGPIVKRLAPEQYGCLHHVVANGV